MNLDRPSTDERPRLEPSGSAVLDPHVLDDLRRLGEGDPNFVVELIDLFLDDAGRRMQALQSASSAGDFEAVLGIAHALKSASANVGALAFADVCKRIEHQAGSDEPAVVGALVERACAMFAQVEGALRRLSQSRGA